PVTRVRYAPARWETLAYRGSMVAAARSPVGFLAATSLVCRQARVVGRLCREEQLELVHAHWWIPGGVSAWLARRPYVVTVHGTDVALLERSPPARMLARRVLRGAAAVTAVSSYLAGRAAHIAGLDQARILVQPMPLDTRAFTRSSRGGGGGGGGGITDIVPSNGAGRLVQPDAREFARALRELADTPDSRRLAAEAGAALRRRFDPAGVAERFEGVYRQAVERFRQGHA